MGHLKSVLTSTISFNYLCPIVGKSSSHLIQISAQNTPESKSKEADNIIE